MTKEKRPQDWSYEEKLEIVIACAPLEEQAISELCREKGIYPHHVKQWKEDFVSGDSIDRARLEQQSSTKLTTRVNQLNKELRRKDKALAEALRSLYSKKSGRTLGRGRGQLTVTANRQAILSWIAEAVSNGPRQSKACQIIGISARTLQRWRQPMHAEDGRPQACREPANKLTELERQRIYTNLSPAKIAPLLADKGNYIASESTFYRVLRAENQLHHRHRTKPGQPKPRALVAAAANQVYCWDITYLPAPVSGKYFYLYMITDIYSRKIVGWQVHDDELAELAADLITETCYREGIRPGQVTLHSDNGVPMKGGTMLANRQKLGVIPSFSRPAVSNDNPYAESLFRTLKYRPEYPDRSFEDIQAARTWVKGFVAWYNYEHLHSSLKFVTPDQRHRGEDIRILANRTVIYERAKKKHPERWSGKTRNWQPAKLVYLNPPKQKIKQRAA